MIHYTILFFNQKLNFLLSPFQIILLYKQTIPFLTDSFHPFQFLSRPSRQPGSICLYSPVSSRILLLFHYLPRHANPIYQVLHFRSCHIKFCFRHNFGTDKLVTLTNLNFYFCCHVITYSFSPVASSKPLC